MARHSIQKHGISTYTNYKCRCDICKEEMRQYLLKRRAELWQIVYNELGQGCKKCGSKNKYYLVVDHIDPNSKDPRIGKKSILDTSFAIPELINELKKCQLLCTECHGYKTGSERTYPIVHGRARYEKYGCRCDICCEAEMSYHKKYNELRRLLRKGSK